MRLIDADRMMRKYIEYEHSTNDPALRNEAQNNVVIYASLLNTQPTAYDVDKVVEQLESESERWKESGEAYEDQKELGVAEGFKRAIDIVKRGGVI